MRSSSACSRARELNEQCYRYNEDGDDHEDDNNNDGSNVNWQQLHRPNNDDNDWQ